MILTEVFQAENISKTATIYLKAPVDIVFPLFGPFEEKKWADGWNPDLLYPHQEKVAVGVSFTTEGNRFEGPYTWRINQYDTSSFQIQYFVFTPNRHWTIDIVCSATESNQTTAQITFTFTGQNPEGNRFNQAALEEMFESNLQDWEKAINHYLTTGSTLVV